MANWFTVNQSQVQQSLGKDGSVHLHKAPLTNALLSSSAKVERAVAHPSSSKEQ
jgi:hypothetical protein